MAAADSLRMSAIEVDVTRREEPEEASDGKNVGGGTDAVGSMFGKAEIERGNWANALEFVLSTSGYITGLGNIWRFPYMVYEYGGGSYLFAYWLLFLLLGFPMFFMESAMGQFSTCGPKHIFERMVPLFGGVGWAMIAVQTLNSIYYNALFAWGLYYMFASMRTPMPWQTCNDTTVHSQVCFSTSEYIKCMGQWQEEWKRARWYAKRTCYKGVEFKQLYDYIEENCLNYYPQVYLHTDDKTLLKKYPNCSVQFNFKLTGGATVTKLFGPLGRDERFLKKYDSCTGVWRYAMVGDDTGEFLLDLTDQTRDSGSVAEIAERLRRFQQIHQHDQPADHLSAHSLLRPVIRHKPQLQRSIFSIVEQYCENLIKTNGHLSKIDCHKEVLNTNEQFSSAEVFESYLHSGSLKNLHGFHWPIPLCLALAWIIIGICLIKGPKWMGKVVYITAIFPVCLILVLIYYATTFPGYKDGIRYYLKTEWCQLGNPKLWLAAISQLLFTLGLGAGGLQTFASYNRFSNNLLRDCFIVTVADTIFSFAAGFGIFGIIGGMAKHLRVPVPFVVKASGPGLAFVTITQATSEIQAGNFFSVLFFVMLGVLAIDSQFGLTETVLTFLFDQFTTLREHRVATVGIVCTLLFLCGLPFVSRSGATLVRIVDAANYEISVALCCLAEIVAVAYVYGVRRFMEDVGMMLEGPQQRDQFDQPKPPNCGLNFWRSPFRWYFFVTWTILCPILVLGNLLLSFVVQEFAKFGFKGRTADKVVYWCFGGTIFPVCFLAGIIYNKCCKKLSWKEMVKPVREWGPAEEENKFGRYLLNSSRSRQFSGGSKTYDGSTRVQNRSTA